jgi:glycosyltransferase involved in cell wall biosynthesis
MAISAIEKGYKVTLLTKVSKYQNVIESSGIKVVDWNLDRSGLNIISEIKSIYSILSLIKRANPDIVHAVALKPIIYSSLISGITNTKIRVLALGGLGYIFSSNKLLARLIRPLLIVVLRLLFKNPKIRLILQNQDDKNLLLDYKIIKSTKVVLIRGAGVNTKEYRPNDSVHKVPVVILPARMLWDKGVSEFVDCAKKFKENGSNARFCLVGSPDSHNPQSIPINQLQDWVKNGIVEWWGQHDHMPNVYSQATIVCLPSYREGLPKSLLEAASCGLPIVTYDVPGCREIVKDEFNGFLIPFKDNDAMYSALLRLIEDKQLSSLMGKNGRKLVLSEFSQDIIGKQTLAVWNESNL